MKHLLRFGGKLLYTFRLLHCTRKTWARKKTPGVTKAALKIASFVRDQKKILICFSSKHIKVLICFSWSCWVAQVRKASHCGSKQQQKSVRSPDKVTLLLLVRATYLSVLFFAHIPFVVNRTFNATSTERL